MEYYQRPHSNLPDDDTYVTNFTPQNQDTSVFGSFQWTTFSIFLTIVLGIIVVGTIVGNFSVLFHFVQSVIRKGDLHDVPPTHFFIANLAVADLAVGIAVLPFLALLQVTGKWYFGQCFCTAWVCTHFWLCAASILSTCAICIERFIGVRFPIKHRNILGVKRIFFALFLVWILAGIPSVIRVFAWNDPMNGRPWKCHIDQKLGHAILAAVGIFYIPAAVMITLYLVIFKIAMQHMNSQKTGRMEKSGGLTYQVSIGTSPSTTKSTDETGDPEHKPSVKQRPKPIQTIEARQINLAKRLTVLVGVVLLSYGPYFTLILLRSINECWVNQQVFDFFAWMRYFNSFLNPFIYAYAVPAFNKAFRKSFKKSFVGRLTLSRPSAT